MHVFKRCMVALAVAALCFASPIFAGGSGETSAGPVELEFWTLWSGGDANTAAEIFEEYNNANENVNITVQTLEWGQFNTKLSTSIVGGTPPDFAIALMGGFTYLLYSEGLIESIEMEGDRLGVEFDFSGYTDAIKLGTFDGKVYSVPVDNLSRVLMFNKDILDEAGILKPDGTPDLEPGFDGFKAAMEKVREARPDVFPLIINTGPPQLVLQTLSLYYQAASGPFVDLDAGKAVFDHAALERAITAYRDIYREYTPGNITAPTHFNMFTEGKGAFYLDGTWQINVTAQKLGDAFGVMGFPQILDRPAVVNTSVGFLLPVNADRTDAETREVLRFIRWFSENNWKWSLAGHLPAYLPSMETPEFKALPYHPYFMNSVKYSVAAPLIPRTLIHTDPVVTEPIQKAILGEITPAEAVAQLQSGLDNLLKQVLE